MTSNGQIIRSLDGIKCISEMPPHMYLSTIVEPSLQTILLSKWSTFPRFLSFIISAIIGFLFISYSTEIPILFASPEYGSQYAFIFFIVCVLLLSIFLLYNSRFYFIWANNLWYKFILKRNFRRFSAADSYCRQYVEFRSDNSILRNHLYRPFNDQPLNVLSKEKLLCLFIASDFIMILALKNPKKVTATFSNFDILQNLYKSNLSFSDSIYIPSSLFSRSDWDTLQSEIKIMGFPTVEISSPVSSTNV